mgnify:CR=1
MLSYMMYHHVLCLKAVALGPCCCGVDIGISGLEKGVTCGGLEALAEAGCGAQLTSLHLECKRHGVDEFVCSSEK